MPLNSKQLIATDPSRNIWLSANAGTGKTFVLAHRFLRLILDGNEISRIVCITYTKAAAAEMQERIVRFIQDLILLDDTKFSQKIHQDYQLDISPKNIEKIRTELAVIIDNPDLLKIKTIHSFCQTILKSFPLESGIPPFFSVIDDYQVTEIEEKAWSKLILSSDNDVILDSLNYLLARFQLRMVKDNLFALKNISNKIFEVINKHQNLNEYINFLKQGLAVDDTDIQHLQGEMLNIYDKHVCKLEELISAKQFGDIYIKNAIKNYRKSHSFDDLYYVFFTKEDKVRNFKPLAKNYPVIHEKIYKAVSDIAFFIELRKNTECFIITKCFLILLEKFSQEFDNLKKLKYLLDYEDLILKTANLLSIKNPNSAWVLYKLDGGIDHILLDESQDTSPSQWKVIEAITEEFFSGSGVKDRKRSLFIVGDEKQSIYSFQGADVNIFNKKREFYNNISKLSEQNNFDFISINTSYRSSEAILKIVDEVLKHEKVKKAVSKQDIIDFHELNRKDSFGYFEISELIKREKKPRLKKEQIEWTLPDEYIFDEDEKTSEKLAKKVASRINEILNRNYPLAGTGNAPKASDIMVLIRSRNKFVDILIREIQKNNIKISGIDRLSLNKNIVIKDLIALAKFTLLLSDDLNLASVLKSPIFSISEDELFNFCWNRGEKTLFENLKIKAYDIYNQLSEYKESAIHGNYKFFYQIIEVFENREKFISYYGTQINEILNEFLNLAENFQQHNNPNLSDFINWFEKNDIEIKRNLNNKSEELRIITAHGSKGLEAPIVIIPDATTASNSRRKFGFDNDIFLCPLVAEYKNKKFLEIENKIKQDEQDEYYRLLYVALTRARDELYIFGAEAKNSDEEKWHNIVLSAVQNLAEIIDDKFIYTSSEYIKPKPFKHIEVKAELHKIDLKYFKLQENTEIISPSKLLNLDKPIKLGDKNSDFIRGLATHKLLELANQLKKEDGEYIFQSIFNTYPEISKTDQQEIKNEVLNIVNKPEFAFIFADNSKAEVPIFGFDNDNLISGKIDRLVILQNKIHIIDYKTNRLKTLDNIEKLKIKYQPQMQSYKNLIQKLYPEKTIKTALLFTQTAKLEYIN